MYVCVCMRMCPSAHGKCAHTLKLCVGRLVVQFHLVVFSLYTWNTFTKHVQCTLSIVFENVVVVVVDVAAATFGDVITGRCQSCVKTKAQANTTNNFEV